METLHDELLQEEPSAVWSMTHEINPILNCQRFHRRDVQPEHRKVLTKGYWSVFSYFTTWIYSLIMTLFYRPVFGIYIFFILYNMTNTVTPQHSGSSKNWKYLTHLDITAQHTIREPQFKQHFDAQAFSVGHEMLKTLYVNDTTENELRDNSIQLLQQLTADCITTDLSITDAASVTHIGALFSRKISFSYLHNKRFHKIRNPSDLGAAFDTVHNTSTCLELYISLTTLWFDKTEPYFDITDWNQITVTRPVNHTY